MFDWSIKLYSYDIRLADDDASLCAQSFFIRRDIVVLELNYDKISTNVPMRQLTHVWKAMKLYTNWRTY